MPYHSTEYSFEIKSFARAASSAATVLVQSVLHFSSLPTIN